MMLPPCVTVRLRSVLEDFQALRYCYKTYLCFKFLHNIIPAHSGVLFGLGVANVL